MKGPVNVEITDGHRKKVVHINRIQPRVLPSLPTSTSNGSAKANDPSWIPPQIEDFVDCEIEEVRRNSLHQCRFPDY